MRQISILFLCLIGWLAAGPALSAPASSPKVIASVLPVQALVADVMEGVGTPLLLIQPGISPHDFTLRPSDARNLQAATLVVRVGAALEPGLDRSLAALKQSRVITLLDYPRLTRHGLRRSNSRIHQVAGEAYDPHLWLDPDNAVIITRLISDALVTLDPPHAARYRRNAAASIERIEQLKGRMQKALSPVQDRAFFTFHDAYQYLETRYHLTNRGFVVNHAEHATVGARHIRELREITRRYQVRCLFTEPEYEPRLIAPLVENMPLRVAMLDHLGADLKRTTEAAGLYIRLMDKLTHDLVSCLEAPAPSF